MTREGLGVNTYKRSITTVENVHSEKLTSCLSPATVETILRNSQIALYPAEGFERDACLPQMPIID